MNNLEYRTYKLLYLYDAARILMIADYDRIDRKIKSLLRNNRHRAEGQLSRNLIIGLLNASYWSCSYCGRYCGLNVTLDHVKPTSQQGKNSLFNLTPSCILCNNAKQSLSVAEFALVRQESATFYKKIIRSNNSRYFQREEIATLMDSGTRLSE